VSYWASTTAKRVFAAIRRHGWEIKQEESGSHKQMIIHPSRGEATWSFQDSEEIGPKMLARLSKVFHFTPSDL
jgi:predicted RNA binding protein YcfA (HicA-like mRNA interferase family)